MRDRYLKNMRKLRFLFLGSNKIVNIEPSAFIDLVKVENLDMSYNLIETFYTPIFSKMKSLRKLGLMGNRIKYLSPGTFAIPQGGITTIDLEDNVCFNKIFESFQLRDFMSGMKANCKHLGVTTSYPDKIIFRS